MPFEIGFKYNSSETELGARGLQAPAPPQGIITTPLQQPQQQTHSAIYATQQKPAPNSQVRSLSPTKAHNQPTDSHRNSSSIYKARREQRHSVGSYFSDLPRMVFFCCCCPIYKCTLWMCLMELLASLYCWYNILNLLVQTMDDVQFKDVFLILFLTFWIVTLFTSTGMLIAAQRRKNASYVLPRLIQQLGLLITSIGLFILLVCYFTGARTTINGYFIWGYKLFLEQDLTAEDEREMARQLNTAAIITILLDIMFICYVSCGLCMTKRYYEKLKEKYGTGFHPVSQNDHEPTAPQQPSSNPYYKA